MLVAHMLGFLRVHMRRVLSIAGAELLVLSMLSPGDVLSFENSNEMFGF